MCGRFSLHLRHNEIHQVPGHDIAIDQWVGEEEEFIPRYNIAPHTLAPVIRRASPSPQDQTDSASTTTSSLPPKYVLQSMKWGLVPHWSKHEDKSFNTTNARAENLVEGGGMWQSIKGKNRCALVTDGYYEWLTKGKQKLPHFTKHQEDGKVMLLAGLYDCVYLEGMSETPLWTFTIVTTMANKSLAWLHDRQPVILSTKEKLDTWLDTTTTTTWTKELTAIVEEPYNGSPLECYPVPKEVGKVGVESSTFIEPVSKRKDGIQAMFERQMQTTTTTTPRTKTTPTTTPTTTTTTTTTSTMTPSTTNSTRSLGRSSISLGSPTKSSPAKRNRSLSPVSDKYDDDGLAGGGASSSSFSQAPSPAKKHKKHNKKEEEEGKGKGKKKVSTKDDGGGATSPSTKKMMTSPSKEKGSETPKITSFFGKI